MAKFFFIFYNFVTLFQRQRNDGESFEVEEMNKEVDTNEEGEIENEHGEKDEPGEEPLKEITAGEQSSMIMIL